MHRPDLVADCTRCAALCCVWSAFDASDDFAFSKPAGTACHHLEPDFGCAIHDELRVRGLGGCAAYDCHGAGQRATRLFASSLLGPRQRHDLFQLLRELHELLWLLTGAATLCPASEVALRADLALAIDALDTIARRPARALLAAELEPHRTSTRTLLRRVRGALAEHATPARRG